MGAEALTLVAWMHRASWLPGTTPIRALSMRGFGGGLSPPRASEAPGYAQAIGHGLAVRVDEYGLKQGYG